MVSLADAVCSTSNGGNIDTLEQKAGVRHHDSRSQLGIHLKLVGASSGNVCENLIYDLLLQFLAHMRDEQFLDIRLIISMLARRKAMQTCCSTA